ncbi:MAG TPA: AraC family transcriptional regulator [Polyangiales bacterium]
MYVSTLFVRILLTELRRRAWAGTQLIEEGLIDPEMLSARQDTISPDLWSKLLLRVVEMTRDPGFGLSFGQSASPSMLHTLGPLIGACSTLRESIAAVQRYQPLLSANTTWALEEHRDVARLYCRDALEDPSARRTSVEATLAFAYGIGRELVAVGSDEVWFEHAAPDYAQRYGRAFRCPVRFGQPRNALVFSRRLLDLRLPHGDLALREVLEAHAAALLDERGGQRMSSRVRALLRAEANLCHVSGSYVAARLKTKTRTLRRLLAAEQMTLSGLVTEAQADIAKRALSAKAVSIKEVAHDLGYSEASAFHRAFKRWTGMTPVEFVRDQERTSHGVARARA